VLPSRAARSGDAARGPASPCPDGASGPAWASAGGHAVRRARVCEILFCKLAECSLPWSMACSFHSQVGMIRLDHFPPTGTHHFSLHCPTPLSTLRLVSAHMAVPLDLQHCSAASPKARIHKDVSAGRAHHSRPTHAVRARPLRHASKKLSPLLTLLVPNYVLYQSGGNLCR